MRQIKLRPPNLIPLSLSVIAIVSLLGCKVSSEDMLLSAYDGLPGKLYLSLAHPYDLKNDDFEMLISAPLDAKAISICVVEEATGICGEETGSKLMFAKDTRKFFLADASILLEHDLTIALIARSDSDEVIDMRTFSFYNTEDPTPGSGGSNNATDATAGAGAGADTPSNPTQPTPVDAASIERANCATAGCHANYAEYSATQKADALSSGRMPRGRTISAEEKDALLKYFQ